MKLNAIAIDTETGLIKPGCLAPPMVCVSFARKGEEGLLHAKDPACRSFIERVFSTFDPIFGHNIAFDVCVLMNEYPDLIPMFFDAYAEGRVADTGLLQKLADIAQGIMRIMESRAGYSLNALGKRLLKRDRSEEKEGDAIWRTRYIELIDVAVQDWPEAARKYAVDDAIETLDCGLVQNQRWAPWLKNSAPQARAALALQLMMCWGLHTDPERVALLKSSAQEAFEKVGNALRRVGFVRSDGTRNVRLVQAYMVNVCREAGMRPKLTETGFKRYEKLVEDLGERKSPLLVLNEKDLVKYTSVDQDACKESGDELLVLYGRYIQLQGVVNTHVPDLEKGAVTPIQARYNTLVDTGRTSCSKGKGKKGAPGPLNGFQMQNPKRDLDYLPIGIRECFVSRSGTLFADNDFSGLELCTVAEVCLELLGHSKLGEALNAGKDPHLMMGADLLKISYEEAQHRKHDKDVKKARQLSKCLNFGLPGGLGEQGFIAFARGYGLKVRAEEFKELKTNWLESWPEFRDYFRWIRDQLKLDSDKKLGELLDSLEDVDEETLERYTIRIPTGTIEQIQVSRFRGRCRFTVACNTLFQGLGADGAKAALWDVTRACYDPTQNSILYGVRPVIFVHDEIVAEVAEALAHEQAFEMSRVMVNSCNRYLPHVPVKCMPALGKYWSKELEAVFDLNGRLQPYDIAKERKQKVFYPDGQPVNWAA